MFKETNYDFGPGIGILKMYSIQHLRCQNPLRKHTPEQLCILLDRNEYSGISLAQTLTARLKNFSRKCLSDRKLIEAIVMDGHWRGLGASPIYSQISDIYWQAAALLLEQYKVGHVNELIQLSDC